MIPCKHRIQEIEKSVAYKNNSKEIQRFDGPAILDMKWSPVGAPGGNRLAISNAEGQISLHQWSDTYVRRSQVQV
jgi:hypothetical protein